MGTLIAIFGKRLRALRKTKGMTLEQLGRATQIGYKHIAEIERGIKVPSFDAIERLAKGLDVEPYELFVPERLLTGSADQRLRVLIRDLDRQGMPAVKRFLAEVLDSARNLAIAPDR